VQRDLTEPYDFIYDRDGTPLARERYASYAPILSFFVGKEFADIPFVTTDDWEVATGRVFPPAATELRSEKNRKQHVVPWEDRIPTAFFRGNSTGLGADPATNQRLFLSKMSNDNKDNPLYGPGNKVDGVAYLDAGVVGFSTRDRKEQGQPMTFMKGDQTFGFKRAKPVPMPQQQRYKYHVYVDGHCAAMRYVTMMALGAVIIRVGSKTKADSMWFFPLLRPYNWKYDPSDPTSGPPPDPTGDHMLVNHDFSDLWQAITWLKTHDKEAHQIQLNCEALYNRMFSVEGQLDYMQVCLIEIAKRFKSKYAHQYNPAATAAAAVVAATDAASGAGGALPSSLSPSPQPPAKSAAKAGKKRGKFVLSDDEEDEDDEKNANNDSFGAPVASSSSSSSDGVLCLRQPSRCAHPTTKVKLAVVAVSWTMTRTICSAE
jgi:Glycosyl transferase family 90